jgi:hypothetical protein
LTQSYLYTSWVASILHSGKRDPSRPEQATEIDDELFAD